MSPLRIAFFVNWFPVISETFIQTAALGLLAEGHEVDVYALRGHPPTPNPTLPQWDSVAQNLHTVTVDTSAASWRTLPETVSRAFVSHGMRAFGALNPLVHKRLILGLQPLHQAAAFRRKGQYDILHAQFSDLAQSVLRHRNAGLLSGGLVTHFRGHDITSHIRKYGLRAHKEVFDRGDWFVANCEHFKRVATDLGCPPERTSVVPSGACVESFPYRERTAPLGRSVNILAVGRLTPQKGFMSAIHAMSILQTKGVSARLRILGEGEDRGILEHEIQRMGLQDNVDLPGAATQQQIAEELDHADLFIAPCRTAPDGAQDAPVNVLKEAMLSGPPVVASRHGGIPELVSHGETGILVEENNDAALAEGIVEILKRASEWPRITKSAREVVINRYSMQVSHAALMEAYTACLDHRKGVLSR